MTYIVTEIQTDATGAVAMLHNIITNEDETLALQQADSVYHQVLASAAISALPVHSATMYTNEGFPIKYECYKHGVVAEE